MCVYVKSWVGLEMSLFEIILYGNLHDMRIFHYMYMVQGV